MTPLPEPKKRIYKYRRQIVFNVPDDWHEEIRERSHRRGETMRRWIMKAIWDKAEREKKFEIEQSCEGR